MLTAGQTEQPFITDSHRVPAPHPDRPCYKDKEKATKYLRAATTMYLEANTAGKVVLL